MRKFQPPGKLKQKELSPELQLPVSLFLQWDTAFPKSSGDPQIISYSSVPGFYNVSDFCSLHTGVHEAFYSPCNSGLFCFSQFYGIPVIKPCWTSKPVSLGILLLLSVPPGWGASCGTQNFHLREKACYIYFLVCGSPTQCLWILISLWLHTSYHLDVASFLLNLFILIGMVLLYNIMVFSPIYWYESAIGAHVFPQSWTPLLPSSPPHPSGLSQSTDFECPASCIELALVIYFTYGNIHASVSFSQINQPSPSLTESKNLFFTSVSLLLSCI